MAYERRTTQYQPQMPPAGMEYGGYMFQEFQRIANVLELLAQGFFFEVATAEPEKPRTGMLQFADGTNWDPGSGRGIYYYDAEQTPSWIKIA